MLRFKTADWREGLKSVIPFVPVKSALPILTSILIMLKDKVLTMTGSDLETSAIWSKEVEFNGNPDESFAIVLNAVHLKSIFEGIKTDKFQFEELPKCRVRIYGDMFNHIVSGEPKDDFPSEFEQVYTGEYELNSMHIGIIDRLKKFANKDEIRRNMSGVFVGDKIAATDGYRLGAAFNSANLQNTIRVLKEKYYAVFDGEEERKVVQARNEYNKILKDEEGNSIYLVTDMEGNEVRTATPEDLENQVEQAKYEDINTGIVIPTNICKELSDFDKVKMQWNTETADLKLTAGNLSIYGKLIDETFPNVESVIPTQDLLINSFTVNRKMLIDNVNAIHSSSDSIVKRIVFNFEGNHLTLSCENTETGAESKITMDCNFKSEQYKEGYQCAFNYQFLLDMLSVLKAEFVTVQFSAQSKAHLVQSEPFTCILMPVRLSDVATTPSTPENKEEEPTEEEVEQEDTVENLEEDISDEELTDEERQAQELAGYISPNPDEEPIDFNAMEVVASEEIKPEKKARKKAVKKSVKKVLPPVKNKKEKNTKRMKKVA